MDASQSLPLRALDIDAAAHRCLPILPRVTVVTAVLGAWLVNFADRCFGDAIVAL
ncbi:hypothetical protein [Caenimonas sedimenti]|uniref:hypothetical protein n=1 Tax=Caenimonas sedimenti TaxID=2596921 RepID=UPI0016450C9B|nr:hypothetical protein [Caenimonas sedimenti]